MFPGQGGQWAGMGRELAAASPGVRGAAGRVRRGAGPARGLGPGGRAGRATGPGLDRADVVQPALWAVMVSLAAVWQAAGVDPGRGGRAFARARSPRRRWPGSCRWRTRRGWWRCAAGRCGRWPGAGGMAVGRRARGPGHGSGWRPWDGPAVGRGGERARGDGGVRRPGRAGGAGRGVRGATGSGPGSCRWTTPRTAPQVEALAAEILAALAGITPGPARIPMVSAMTGEWLDGPGAGRGVLVRQPARARCSSTGRSGCWPRPGTGCSSRCPRTRC